MATAPHTPFNELLTASAPRSHPFPPIPAPAAPEDMTQGYGGATGGTPAGTPESQVAKEVSGAC